MSSSEPPRCPSTGPGDAADWVPPWVRQLDVPVWVSDARRRLRWLNERAAGLLQGAVTGRPCHEVVAGQDGAGCSFCSPRCAPIVAMCQGASLPPVTLEVGPPGRRRWVQTLLIPWQGPRGAALVHCAVDAERAQRLARYLGRVAARSAALAPIDAARLRALSQREREVLEHLARDEDPSTIARALFISTTTVRNHVQHLLAAMGAHSVHEAVARYLLDPASLDGDLG